MFAFEKINFKTRHDSISGSITNGYFPMGACLINERIEKSVKMFNHDLHIQDILLVVQLL